MPVEVVRGNTQHHAHIRRQRQSHQLETRKFQNAHSVCRFRFEQVERRHTEVSADFIVHAALGQNVADHAHGRTLAERTCNADNLLGFSLF